MPSSSRIRLTLSAHAMSRPASQLAQAQLHKMQAVKAARDLNPQPAAPRTRVGLAFNFAVLAGGEFLAKLLTFAVFTFLARTLGPARYGNIEFTLAVMVFFTLVVDSGLSTYGAREIARDN